MHFPASALSSVTYHHAPFRSRGKAQVDARARHRDQGEQGTGVWSQFVKPMHAAVTSGQNYPGGLPRRVAADDVAGGQCRACGGVEIGWRVSTNPRPARIPRDGQRQPAAVLKPTAHDVAHPNTWTGRGADNAAWTAGLPAPRSAAVGCDTGEPTEGITGQDRGTRQRRVTKWFECGPFPGATAIAGCQQ